MQQDSAQGEFTASELVIGLVGAVGVELRKVSEILQDRLKIIGYNVHEVHISQHVIPFLVDVPDSAVGDEYGRISDLMDAGNEARRASNDNQILALGAASKIAERRPGIEEGQPRIAPRRAHIISSLKHPDEVAALRQIYPQGFYLIGVHSDEDLRLNHLVKAKRIIPENAVKLMDRDKDEHLEYGQRVTDTFHLSDFFVRIDGSDPQLTNSIWRLLDILFGYPYHTPTFDEYAMFLAFAASLRSSDLSRQVGAVVADDMRREVLATGANDCPKAGGGLYWPEFNESNQSFEDEALGRDYMRKQDPNQAEQQKITKEILDLAEARK